MGSSVRPSPCATRPPLKKTRPSLEKRTCNLMRAPRISRPPAVWGISTVVRYQASLPPPPPRPPETVTGVHVESSSAGSSPCAISACERHCASGRLVIASSRLSVAAYGSERWVWVCAGNAAAAKRTQIAALGNRILFWIPFADAHFDPATGQSFRKHGQIRLAVVVGINHRRMERPHGFRGRLRRHRVRHVHAHEGHVD